MVSREVLDYQFHLDQAFARPDAEGKPLLAPALRRQAIKDARRILDGLAFRFALLDERALPEDSDYAQAIEAMKAPDATAALLARRAPFYRRVRRRRLVTSWTILTILITLVASIAYFGTSEDATELILVSQSAAAESTESVERLFTVTPEMNRLHVDGTIIVSRESKGVIEVRILDPQGRVRLFESHAPQSNIWLRKNIPDPEPGEWTLLVDFLGVTGSARVSIQGVYPAR